MRSVLIHPRQREGLRVLERCYEERINNSAASRGDTKDADRRAETKVLPKIQARDQGTRRRLEYSPKTRVLAKD